MAKPFCVNLELRGLRQNQNSVGDALRYLLGYNLGGLWTFLAHTFFKFDRLAFSKSLKTVPLNFRKMNKEVFAALGLNETKTLTLVKPFYCSYCHDKFSPAIVRERTSRIS